MRYSSPHFFQCENTEWMISWLFLQIFGTVFPLHPVFPMLMLFLHPYPPQKHLLFSDGFVKGKDPACDEIWWFFLPSNFITPRAVLEHPKFSAWDWISLFEKTENDFEKNSFGSYPPSFKQGIYNCSSRIDWVFQHLLGFTLLMDRILNWSWKKENSKKSQSKFNLILYQKTKKLKFFDRGVHQFFVDRNHGVPVSKPSLIKSWKKCRHLFLISIISVSSKFEM